MLRRARRPLLFLALALSAAAQQATLPPGHPEIENPNRRTAAAELTEAVAPPADASEAKPVPRRNFIDKHIFSKMERDRVRSAPLASDEVFFRRIHLDLTGRIPDGEAARGFVADPDPGKREKLIDELVGGVEWREKWTHWFLDLWRASQNRIGWEGRNLFHGYVYDALQLNQPFDEFVREMITASARSNYYVGPSSYLVRWAQFADNCTEIMHEDTADEMTIMLFKHFMGLNLQCVSCHDGAGHLEKMSPYLTSLKREELWAQAAFFGRTRVLRRVEIRNTQDEYLIDDKERVGYRADAPSTVRVARTGDGFVAPRFLLNGETPEPDKPLRDELARMFTGHPQFARATVNRIWAEMMGAGIVEPVDDFDLMRMDPDKLPEGWDLQPTHPELLDALAQDFIDSGFDLQHLFRTIAKSSTYQLSSSYPGEWKPDYARYFARKFIRRLPAESVYDALIKATGLAVPMRIPRTDKSVDYLVQLRGPADIKASGSLAPKFKKDLYFFVESFGQANREFNEPTREGSIIQAALMMNSPIVKEKIRPLRGSYLRKLIDDDQVDEEQMTERLFWQFLTRAPDAEEKDAALTLLAERGPAPGGEDLQWVLVNKLEFLFSR